MDSYQIVFKQTDELTNANWDDYLMAFNNVFKKDYTKEYFQKKYFGSSFGYSGHGMLMHDNHVVGMFSVIPRQYIHSGSDITIGLGCDAFILKEHRKDEFFLKQMADVVTNSLMSKGVTLFISIPNKTAYPYWIYYGGWKDIGKLNYYILPLRISKLIGKFEFLDKVTYIFLKSMISFFSFFSLMSKKSLEKSIHIKRNKEYFMTRYTSEYRVHTMKDNSSFVYRICVEDNIRTAYLIDCYPLSSKNITDSLNILLKETKGNIDIVLFVGRIDNPPFYFIKVPEKKEPRIQPFIGLNTTDCADDDFFQIDTWDVGLANFDNR